MKVGFLHVRNAGLNESGISKYGRSLAKAVAQLGVDIAEVELELSGRSTSDRAALHSAALRLRGCDLLHAQYSRYLWGFGSIGARLLSRLRRTARAPLVVTFHDVQSEIYPNTSVLELLQECYRGVRGMGYRPLWASWRALRLVINGHLADRKTLHWLVHRTSALIVGSDEERQRLLHCGGTEHVRVIPLFVPPRILQQTRAEARKVLGLEEMRAVVLLGYIFEQKGHRVALKALSLLPKNHVLVFAGAPTATRIGFARQLEEEAATLGVSDRLRITGYLSDAEFERYLLAADVAICPFLTMSASASLTDWFSTGATPVIAADLPQMRQFNSLAPGAMQLIPANDARALADAILKADPATHQEARQKLRALLSIETMAQRHLSVYESVFKSASLV